MKPPLTTVTALTTNTDKERAERAQAMRMLAEEWPALVESFAISARIARAKYLAFVKEGFTEAQALELCK